MDRQEQFENSDLEHTHNRGLVQVQRRELETHIPQVERLIMSIKEKNGSVEEYLERLQAIIIAARHYNPHSHL